MASGGRHPPVRSSFASSSFFPSFRFVSSSLCVHASVYPTRLFFALAVPHYIYLFFLPLLRFFFFSRANSRCGSMYYMRKRARKLNASLAIFRVHASVDESAVLHVCVCVCAGVGGGWGRGGVRDCAHPSRGFALSKSTRELCPT